MSSMTKVTIKLPKLPKGAKYTGEFRTLEKGEYFLNNINEIQEMTTRKGSARQYHVIEVPPVRKRTNSHYFTIFDGAMFRVKDIGSPTNDLHFKLGLYWTNAQEAVEVLERLGYSDCRN